MTMFPSLSGFSNTRRVFIHAIMIYSVQLYRLPSKSRCDDLDTSPGVNFVHLRYCSSSLFAPSVLQPEKLARRHRPPCMTMFLRLPEVFRAQESYLYIELKSPLYRPPSK